MSFSEYIQQLQIRVNEALAHRLPPISTNPSRLHDAMRYSVINGGKRLRPILVYATGEALGAPLEELDDPACAVELIHAYSLIHDDLPAMDDDDMRRGRPSCHKAFDEATAILAGDALQAQAFHVLAEGKQAQMHPNTGIEMLKLLSQACGSLGLVGGQSLDLCAIGKKVDLNYLERMHRLKTGALIHASVLLGGLAAHAKPEAIANLSSFASQMGLAFQIQDDILDVGTDTILTLEKPTYTSLLGLENAKIQVKQLLQSALQCLQHFGTKAQRLRELAHYIVERDY
jgi:geranylgeranyl pyrophosphate synthase